MRLSIFYDVNAGDIELAGRGISCVLDDVRARVGRCDRCIGSFAIRLFLRLPSWILDECQSRYPLDRPRCQKHCRRIDCGARYCPDTAGSPGTRDIDHFVGNNVDGYTGQAAPRAMADPAPESVCNRQPPPPQVRQTAFRATEMNNSLIDSLCQRIDAIA